ncbi:MAG: hypothetical protein SFW62_02425 [Alphaproteobacteria bacterium]|nr:hypothetical protein [Alphaproteobacteria bacterium]
MRTSILESYQIGDVVEDTGIQGVVVGVLDIPTSLLTYPWLAVIPEIKLPEYLIYMQACLYGGGRLQGAPHYVDRMYEQRHSIGAAHLYSHPNDLPQKIGRKIDVGVPAIQVEEAERNYPLRNCPLPEMPDHILDGRILSVNAAGAPTIMLTFYNNEPHGRTSLYHRADLADVIAHRPTVAARFGRALNPPPNFS